MKFLRSKKAMVAAGLATGLLVSGGIAYAYWTAGGTGTGSATTKSGVSVVVNQGSSVTNLAPGGVAQALSGTFDNTTGAPVRVNSVAVSIGSVTGGAGVNCTAADYTLVQPTTIGGKDANGNIPTGTTVGTWSGGSIAFNNSLTTAQDDCKGATVNLSYTAS